MALHRMTIRISENIIFRKQLCKICGEDYFNLKNEMKNVSKNSFKYTSPDSHKLKFAIISSRFNNPIEENLVNGAIEALKENNIDPENINVVWVPGAFEIPLIAKKLAGEKKYDALITLGCVIKGETAHFEYICEVVAHQLGQISLDYEIPLGFGILTTYTLEQAQFRSSNENNKGYECALVVLEMIGLLNNLK